MAIGPDELKKTFSETDKEIIAKLEKAIDEFLRQEYQGEGDVSFIFTDDNKLPPPRVIKELIRRYKKAGWSKVEFDDDEREGSWLLFE